MSGFSYPQPTFVSDIYNPSFYLTVDANGYLTYYYAKTIFLDRNDYRLAYLSGVSVGIGTPGTALVLNSSSSITGGLVDLTASGTFKGATINATTGFQLNGVALDFTNLSYLSGITAGTAVGYKALIMSSTRTISNIATITMDTAGTGLYTPNMQFWFNSTWTNFDHSMYLNIVQGGCVAQKALVVDNNKDISGIRNFGCTGTSTLSGAVSCGSITTSSTNTVNTYGITLGLGGMSSTGSISVSGTSTISAYGITAGTGGLTGTIKTASQTNITSIGTLGSLTITNGLSVGSITVSGSGTISAYGITAGTGGLTGTIQTASQTNITSVGTLGSLAVSGSVSCTKIDNAQSVITNGGANYLSTTSRVDPYNLVLVSPADIVGTGSGIAFFNDGLGSVGFTASSYTPSCSIIAERITGSYAASDLVFSVRSADAATSSLRECIRCSQSGIVSVGGIAGAQNLNLLKNASCGFRIGHSESSKNCMTLQYTYAGAASDNNTISVDVYGSNNALVIKSNNQVGINATAANISAELYVNGWMRGTQLIYITANSSSNASYVGNWSSSNYWGIGSDSTVGSIRFGVCSILGVWSAYVPVRGGAYTNASDRRLKKDIIDIPYGLEAVMKMKPRRFKMIQEQTDHVGFIAQEMAEIVPEAVAGEECPNDTLNEQGFPVDPMGIDLASLTAVLCKAIQEQQEVLLSQQSRIEELEKKIPSLI